jgi:CHASE3 domain sensor protein
MTALRTRIASGFAILALPTLVLAVVALAAIDRLGRAVDTVLLENERTLDAAAQMDVALERMDSAALLALLGRDAEAAEIVRTARPAFRDALGAAESNLTVEGEGAVVARVREGFADFDAAYARLSAPSLEPDARRAVYATQLVPAFGTVRAGLTELRRINREAAMQAGERAGGFAGTARWLVIAGALVALLLCAWVAVRLSRQIADEFGGARPGAGR